LEYLVNYPIALFKTAFYVDSKSVLYALESFNLGTRPDLIIETNHLIHCLRFKGTDVSICWLPSDVGIYGNEVEDKAAKRGAQR
jgi:hypothetical protein